MGLERSAAIAGLKIQNVIYSQPSTLQVCHTFYNHKNLNLDFHLLRKKKRHGQEAFRCISCIFSS